MRCDPMALGLIKKKDQILPYFVIDKLSFVPGLPGLFIAAAIGGALSMNPSPFVRHTFFNTFANGFFSYLLMYNVNQIYIQRISSVKSIKTARSVLVFLFFMYLLIFSCGLVAYATYAGCNPMALGIIKKKEQIMPYFIMDKLGFIPGFPGLYFATLIAGSLSTLSSYMNASVCSSVERTCAKILPFLKNVIGSTRLSTNKNTM
ncbi:Sodium-coupled monocarboxylate transporter 2 [Armadillidium vulgare]|nr:Sodium-coupled monocarboxylate transporter 2 [Armadillidium vulgare]